jgi:hypothetical protein
VEKSAVIAVLRLWGDRGRGYRWLIPRAFLHERVMELLISPAAGGFSLSSAILPRLGPPESNPVRAIGAMGGQRRRRLVERKPAGESRKSTTPRGASFEGAAP